MKNSMKVSHGNKGRLKLSLSWVKGPWVQWVIGSVIIGITVWFVLNWLLSGINSLFTGATKQPSDEPRKRKIVTFDADGLRSQYTPRTGNPIPMEAAMDDFVLPRMMSKPAPLRLNMALMSRERRMEVRFPGHSESGENWLYIGSADKYELINGKHKTIRGYDLNNWTSLSWKGKGVYSTGRTLGTEIIISDPAEKRRERVRIPTYWELPSTGGSIEIQIPSEKECKRTLYIRFANLEGEGLPPEFFRAGINQRPFLMGFQDSSGGVKKLLLHSAEKEISGLLPEKQSRCLIMVPKVPGGAGVRLEVILLLEP